MTPKETVHPLDLVVRHGIRVSRPGFTLYFKRTAESHRPRIVISQKLDKRAVVRNRLRRRVRSALTPYLMPGLGIVVVCRPDLLKLTPQDLREQLANVFNRPPWSN